MLVVAGIICGAAVSGCQTPPHVVSGLQGELSEVELDFDPPGHVVIGFSFLPDSHASSRERVVNVATDVVQLLERWYGFPRGRVSVVEGDWNATFRAAASENEVRVSIPWMSVDHDMTLERTVIASFARHYWSSVGAEWEPPLSAALAHYTAARAIDALLEGRHFDTQWFFGGFVPHTIRSLPLWRVRTDPRPLVRWFPEFEERRLQQPAWGETPADDTVHGAASLHTLERFIGHPAMQQALASLHAQFAQQQAGIADLADIVGRQRGQPMSWFPPVFHAENRIDYGVEQLTVSEGPPYETRIRVRRSGDAVFGGAAGAGTQEARAVAVVTRFTDGSEMHEWWPGTEQVAEFAYTSDARPVSAAVDPETILVLDADRTNNASVIAPAFSLAAARLALNWLVWLQNVVLTCTALI